MGNLVEGDSNVPVITAKEKQHLDVLNLFLHVDFDKVMCASRPGVVFLLTTFTEFTIEWLSGQV